VRPGRPVARGRLADVSIPFHHPHRRLADDAIELNAGASSHLQDNTHGVRLSPVASSVPAALSCADEGTTASL